MAEEQCYTDVYAEELATYNELNEMKQKRLDLQQLQEMLTMSKETVDSILQRVSDLPAKLVSEMDSMIKVKEMLEYLKKRSAEKLNDIEKKNKEMVRKQASLLRAKDMEYKREVIELVAMEQEVECLQTILKQKEAKLADLEKESQEEAVLYARQTTSLKGLVSRPGSKGGNLSFVEENRALLAASAKIDKVFATEKAEIENLIKENSALSQSLTAAKSENSLKSLELAALKLKAVVYKEICVRAENKQRNILSEHRTTEERRKVTISQLEQQLAGQRTSYENVQKKKAGLNEQISSEFGNSKSLEEMMVEAEKELLALNAEHCRLTESVDGISRSINANDTKLNELREAEILQDLYESHMISKPSTHDQGSQTSKEEPQQMEDFEDSDEEGSVFLMSSPSRVESQQLEEEMDQDVGDIVQCPDSSVPLGT